MARSTRRSREQGAPDANEPLSLPVRVRRVAIIATALGGFALGWAALSLPWRPEAPLALLLWVLAAANLCALVALLGSGRHARRAVGWLVALSLGAAPLLVGAIVVTSVVMVRMYGPLGWGLTVALGAIAWLLLLVTLPVGLVGLRYLRARAVAGPSNDDA